MKRHKRTAVKLYLLGGIGPHIREFTANATKNIDKKPYGYPKLNLNNTNQLALAILKTIKNRE